MAPNRHSPAPPTLAPRQATSARGHQAPSRFGGHHCHPRALPPHSPCSRLHTQAPAERVPAGRAGQAPGPGASKEPHGALPGSQQVPPLSWFPGDRVQAQPSCALPSSSIVRLWRPYAHKGTAGPRKAAKTPVPTPPAFCLLLVTGDVRGHLRPELLCTRPPGTKGLMRWPWKSQPGAPQPALDRPSRWSGGGLSCRRRGSVGSREPTGHADTTSCAALGRGACARVPLWPLSRSPVETAPRACPTEPSSKGASLYGDESWTQT